MTTRATAAFIPSTTESRCTASPTVAVKYWTTFDHVKAPVVGQNVNSEKSKHLFQSEILEYRSHYIDQTASCNDDNEAM